MHMQKKEISLVASSEIIDAMINSEECVNVFSLTLAQKEDVALRVLKLNSKPILNKDEANNIYGKFNVSEMISKNCSMLKNDTSVKKNSKQTCVVYWMNRDCRINDNYALVFAEQIAKKQQVPLIILYNLHSSFLGSTYRQYHFKTSGILECARNASQIGVPFIILHEPIINDKKTNKEKTNSKKNINDAEKLLDVINQLYPVAIVTDFSPLKIQRVWSDYVRKHSTCAMFGVDTHNIVPCWTASTKQEFAARTFRPKISKLLKRFLVTPQSLRGEEKKISNSSNLAKSISEIENLNPHVYSNFNQKRMDKLLDLKIAGFPNIFHINISRSQNHSLDSSGESIINIAHKPSSVFVPGNLAGLNMLNEFVTKKIYKYNEFRNDSNIDACSNLSPYLHYGQISPQRVALEVLNHAVQKGYSAKDVLPIEIKTIERSNVIDEVKNYITYLEELIVRRELADNFCFYNSNYDSFAGYPQWAQKSLNSRRLDVRQYVYSKKEFELAKTHDELWNASQFELLKRGKIHGYMRMYWAKKILEWSKSPEEASDIAIYLNDTYEIDGRDPGGYTGIAWSLGGLHDRPWFKRPIFGDIRFMARSGAEKKFNVLEYIDTWSNS